MQSGREKIFIHSKLMWLSMPDRISRCIAAVQPFAARVMLFHAGMAKKLRLNPAQFKCLRLVQIAGEAFATGLARECELSLPAMTVILDRFESLGFVTRQRDAKDRRRDAYTSRRPPEVGQALIFCRPKHQPAVIAPIISWIPAEFREATEVAAREKWSRDDVIS
jgi:DNA-binding MarR family transcriptional regulator